MTTLRLEEMLRDFGIDLVAIVVLAFGVYFRRYRRRDNTVGFIAFNLSLFVVAAALASTTAVTLGVGFGLFAVLSIVRLRSDESTQSEIGYTMVSLVLGLLNGLPGMDTSIKITFSAGLVAAMYLADHPRLFAVSQMQRVRVELDRVIVDEAALRAEVESRLGSPVRQLTVLEIDYVRESMRLDVRVIAT